MDFNANISKTQLQYTYTSLGVYIVVFYVSNPLGAKWFTLQIQVVDGMYGLYISLNPLYSPVGGLVDVSAYLVQGNGNFLSLSLNRDFNM